MDMHDAIVNDRIPEVIPEIESDAQQIQNNK